MLFPFHRESPRKNPGAGSSAQTAVIAFLTIVAINMVRVAIAPPRTPGAASAPAVSLSPASLALGSEPVDSASSPQVITLKNTGGAALKISSIAITGANAADFNENTTCGSSVAAGGNCTIVILLTPSAVGARKVSLTIADNAGAASPSSVALSGAGTHEVTLAWTPSITAGVSAYNVYRGTASEGESATPLNSTPIIGTAYTDATVSGGTTYYYVATAIASDDVTQSAYSNETSAAVPGP